jgi:hypothetical protein
MYLRKEEWALSYVVPQSIWSNYLVEGLPQYGSDEALLKSHSGFKG